MLLLRFASLLLLLAKVAVGGGVFFFFLLFFLSRPQRRLLQLQFPRIVLVKAPLFFVFSMEREREWRSV